VKNGSHDDKEKLALFDLSWPPRHQTLVLVFFTLNIFSKKKKKKKQQGSNMQLKDTSTAIKAHPHYKMFCILPETFQCKTL